MAGELLLSMGTRTLLRECHNSCPKSLYVLSFLTHILGLFGGLLPSRIAPFAARDDRGTLWPIDGGGGKGRLFRDINNPIAYDAYSIESSRLFLSGGHSYMEVGKKKYGLTHCNF